MRDGPFGSREANARIDADLRRHAGAAAQGEWYPGRRVLVTRNDPDSGLFNGDIGLCLADADGRLRVWFETPAVGGEAPARACARRAAHHRTGLRADRAQEPRLRVRRGGRLLPPDPMHRLLSRELLYTAASRAKHRLTLHADEAVVAACLARTVRRTGGLHVRLAEALDPR